MKLETERDALDWLSAARALAVVNAWSELGLFQKLRNGPMHRAELGADARALAVTIPVLAHVGLLATDGERVGLTVAAERLLAEGEMPSGRELAMLRDLGRMTDVLRSGGPVKDEQGRSKATRGGTTVDNLAETERFLDYLYRISKDAATSTFTWLAPDLPARASVLDLGGGHGRYARTFADGGHATTLYDQPMVVELARKRHGDALSYRSGDFHAESSFGGPYDLILLCNIVHGESEHANASLVARAAKALKSGGRVVIRDMFLDEHGTDPQRAVFFGMTMLFYTENGTSPSTRQCRTWLESAGLGQIRFSVFDTHQIMSGRKG